MTQGKIERLVEGLTVAVEELEAELLDKPPANLLAAAGLVLTRAARDVRELTERIETAAREERRATLLRKRKAKRG